jgi:hypothetical protein
MRNFCENRVEAPHPLRGRVWRAAFCLRLYCELVVLIYIHALLTTHYALHKTPCDFHAYWLRCRGKSDPGHMWLRVCTWFVYKRIRVKVHVAYMDRKLSIRAIRILVSDPGVGPGPLQTWYTCVTHKTLPGCVDRST